MTAFAVLLRNYCKLKQINYSEKHKLNNFKNYGLRFNIFYLLEVKFRNFRRKVPEF